MDTLVNAESRELLGPDQVLEKFNFIILDNRETLISGKLQLSISMRNMIYKSYLVSSTYIKIIKLESHYCIGREFLSVYPTGWHQIWPGAQVVNRLANREAGCRLQLPMEIQHHIVQLLLHFLWVNHGFLKHDLFKATNPASVNLFTKKPEK